MKSPIYINSNNTVVYKSGNYLVVDRNGKKIPCPPESVSYIIKFGNSRMSEQTLNFCANKGIAVHRFSYGGKYNGVFLPPSHNIGKIRLKQYEAYFGDKRLIISKEIVNSASKNKAYILSKYYYKNKNKELKKIIKGIKELNKKIEKQDNIDSLRGIEGAIGAFYFNGLKKCLKYFKFEKREYNPPPDEFNSITSFSYAMLYAEILSKVYEHGLCPYLGYLHEQNNGNLSLVYDLSEMFKQEVDLFNLGLINTNQFKDFHFNKKEDGACLLNTPGKSFFHKKWIPFLREVKNNQSRSEKIRMAVIQLKKYLEEGGDFEGVRL